MNSTIVSFTMIILVGFMLIPVNTNFAYSQIISEQFVEDDVCVNYATNLYSEDTPWEYEIGIQLIRLGNVNLKSGAFDADFWIWIQALEDDDPTLRDFVNSHKPDGSVISPTEWIDFTNGGDIKIKSFEYDEELNEILLRVQGTFFSQFDLKNFPFEILKMKIQAESPAGNIFDLSFTEASNAIDKTATLSDINVNKALAKIVVHQYDKFDTTFDQNEVTEFSDTYCRFVAIYVEEDSFAVAKYLLPLFLITALGLMPLWMGKEYVSRIVLSTFLFGGLIVFVNATISQLPELSYLTIFDKIYMIVYALFTLSITSSVIQQRASSVDENSPNIERVNKYSRLLIPVIIIIGIAIIIISK